MNREMNLEFIANVVKNNSSMDALRLLTEERTLSFNRLRVAIMWGLDDTVHTLDQFDSDFEVALRLLIVLIQKEEHPVVFLGQTLGKERGGFTATPATASLLVRSFPEGSTNGSERPLTPSAALLLAHIPASGHH